MKDKKCGIIISWKDSGGRTNDDNVKEDDKE